MKIKYFGIVIEAFPEENKPRKVIIFNINKDIESYINGAKNQDNATVPEENRYSWIYSASNGKGWSCIAAVYAAKAVNCFFCSGIPFVFDGEKLEVWNEKIETKDN